MSQQTDVKPRTRTKTRSSARKLWKVILLNDDYTPREFVVDGTQGSVPHGRGDGLRRDADRPPGAAPA